MPKAITTEIASGQALAPPPFIFNRNGGSIRHHRAVAARSLEPDEQESVRRLAREWIVKLGSQTELAKALGFKPQHISAMTRKENPTAPGVPFARSLAELAGISLDQALGHDPGAELTIERDDPYPRLTRATRAFRDLGGLEQAATQVREAIAKGQQDREELEWLEELLDANRGMKFVLRNPAFAAQQSAAAKAHARTRLEESQASETPRQRSERIARENAAKRKQEEDEQKPPPPKKKPLEPPPEGEEGREGKKPPKKK